MGLKSIYIVKFDIEKPTSLSANILKSFYITVITGYIVAMIFGGGRGMVVPFYDF